MPTYVNKPFGGGYQQDAFDQGDMFSAQLDEARRKSLQDRIDELSMVGPRMNMYGAQLGEQAREFDANRSDSLAQRTLMAQMLGKQMDLASQRQSWEMDPERNPTLQAAGLQNTALKSSLALQEEQLARRKQFQTDLSAGKYNSLVTDPRSQQLLSVVSQMGGDPSSALLSVMQGSRGTADAKLAAAREDLANPDVQAQARGHQEWSEAVAQGAQPIGKPLPVDPMKALNVGEAGFKMGKLRSLMERYKNAGAGVPYSGDTGQVVDAINDVVNSATKQGADANQVRTLINSQLNELIPAREGLGERFKNNLEGIVGLGLGSGIGYGQRANELRDVLGL